MHLDLDPAVLKLALVCCALATAIAVIFAARGWWKAWEARRQAQSELSPVSKEDEAVAIGEIPGQKKIPLAGLARLMRPKSGEELSALRLNLAQAGMRSPEAIALFGVVRGISVIVGAFLFLVLIIGSGFNSGGMLLGCFFLLGGLYVPKFWLNSKIQARQDILSLSLPPTLDLLVTCIEAGLGLEQALDRVATEIVMSDPIMAEELSVVVGEIRAGLSVGGAFRKLSERVTSDEVRNLSNVIAQSAALGAALGRTLRDYATSARRRRELALEETAGKITARLTLPLTICLLPSSMLAMMGPAVVIVINTMF